MSMRHLFPLLLLSAAAMAADDEIGFIEKFALSPDREAALKLLVPATEDAYYYQALHFLSAGKPPALREVLEQWSRRFPDSERRRIIENRAALIGYAKTPQETLRFLEERLGPDLAHERPTPEGEAAAPSRVTGAEIAPAVFEESVLRDDDLARVGEPVLAEFIRRKVPLSPAQVRSLLGKLTRPDVAGVVELVEGALRSKESRGFGEFPIHAQLLPAQLDDLAKRQPALLNEPPFVLARLRQLLPSADIDLDFDSAARAAWLERAWAFAAKLAPSFNTLKAQILFQRLTLGRARGEYDRALFIEYLKLPRRTDATQPALLDQLGRGSFAVDLAANGAGDLPGLPAIGQDGALVRDYLLHFFREESSWEPWTAWLRAEFVTPLFAEAKITAGSGDPEKWASLLTPAAFQTLRDRVDIDFAPTNPRLSAPAEPVAIAVALKNTPKLLVKVYELNPLSFFLTEKRQLNTDVNLAGLVATQETTHDFTADPVGRDPFRRWSRTFDFPELKGRRGAWIVEFIGGGRSSRALIRKGQWHVLPQLGPAGDALTIVDEAGQPVPDAVAWLDGRRLTPDARTGAIMVPFTKSPGPKSIVLADAAGTFASLASFEHHAESYALAARVHLEREELLAGREATLLLRPQLRLGGEPVSLALLEDARLTITSTTLDGITAQREIPGVKWDANAAFTHRFPVPARAGKLEVTLHGSITPIGGGEKIVLRDTHAVELNTIAASENIFDLHLVRLPAGYALDVLGRNGEPVPKTAVVVQVRRAHFPESIRVDLATDERGRVELGALEGIVEIYARIEAGAERTWPLVTAGASPLPIVHARAGEAVRLPWISPVTKLTPRDVSLLERRGGQFVADRFDALSLADGFLVATGLAPGDYSLARSDGSPETIIRVTAGGPVAGWLVAPARQLERRPSAPVQIESARLDAAGLVIQVRHANAQTRVHVAVSRFVPTGPTLFDLGAIDALPTAALVPARRPNLFTSGRAIGDEYRYILERRSAKIFPGNLLPRPGLLLNPWEVRKTDLEAVTSEAGEALSRIAGEREAAKMAQPIPSSATSGEPAPPAPESTPEPSLDFLSAAAPTHYDLAPDAQGLVRLPRAALGDRHYVQILAEDTVTAAWRVLATPETTPPLAEQRLTRPLDPGRPFTQTRAVTPLATGQSLQLADRLAADLETYETVGSAFELLQSLVKADALARFRFLAQWPALSPEEKRAKYSEHACHEVNFFLSRKDPAFFAEVVLPHLRNKRDRTFLDDFLLGANLQRYLAAWDFQQLNVFERCLLAQRLPGEAEAMRRHVRELWELRPPAPAEEAQQFATALQAPGFSDTDGGRVGDALVLAEKSAGSKMRPMRRADIAAPAAGAALAPAPPPPAAPVARLAADAVESVRLRREVRAYFRELGPTAEWAENNYDRRRIAEQNGDLLPINAFWRDYAAWDGKAPFLSAHLPAATSSATEALLALAVLDLPFTAGPHTIVKNGAALTLTAASPLLAFHQEIAPAAAADEGPSLLVSENFFRADDRLDTSAAEPAEKYVTDEFLPRVIYGAKVVVTNPRSTAQRVEILTQIPEGSIAVAGTRSTESHPRQLAAFSTETFEYTFYFPAAREQPFAHYPAHVSREGKAAGAAEVRTFRVVPRLTNADTKSWAYVAEHGSDDAVFAFLEKQNLARLDFEPVAWRVRQSAAFFRRLVAFLGQHHVWSEPIYRYALRHDDAPSLREWLRHQDEFVAACGPWLDSPLLRIDPVARRSYEHLEYSPLVNQRAHRFGREQRIANPVIRSQYRHLLEILAHKPALDAADQLAVVYYLFLQDRVEEALVRLRGIAPDQLPTRLQYDYLACYAALYEADRPTARRIAASYASYPVDRWRQLFAEVTAQLDEAEGRPAARPNEKTPTQNDLATSEPGFDFKVENRTVALTWRNLRDVTINYYLMDPELLFSSSPFVGHDGSRFSIIRPTRSDQQALPADRTALEIPLPAAFAQANVLVEVLGAGQRKAQSSHANTLKLTLAENYGRLDLREAAADRPVARAYVKVYARLENGQVRFFKDGYTDLRGRFDYASLNSSAGTPPPRPLSAPRPDGGATGLDYPQLAPDELRSVARLAILVLSETNGATLREVSPPSR